MTSQTKYCESEIYTPRSQASHEMTLMTGEVYKPETKPCSMLN